MTYDIYRSPLIIGLTGGICCGKSTVSKTFIKNHIPIVDADQVARDVVVVGSKGLQSVIDAFGSSYLNQDGSLNRLMLGNLVFNNFVCMNELNSIMGPLIDEVVKNKIIELVAMDYKIIVYDAPILIESGHADKYRPLIVVHCPREMQIARLIKRNGLTEEQAVHRINAQLSSEQKIAMADFTIDTSGTVEESVKQTEEIILKLKAML